jgi:hypothetical protein
MKDRAVQRARRWRRRRRTRRTMETAGGDLALARASTGAAAPEGVKHCWIHGRSAHGLARNTSRQLLRAEDQACRARILDKFPEANLRGGAGCCGNGTSHPPERRGGALEVRSSSQERDGLGGSQTIGSSGLRSHSPRRTPLTRLSGRDSIAAPPPRPLFSPAFAQPACARAVNGGRIPVAARGCAEARGWAAEHTAARLQHLF